MTPKERFDQALKTSIGDPYESLLSFSINNDGITLLQLHNDVLKNDVLFDRLLLILRKDLPTRFLHVSLQPHEEDYSVENRFSRLRDSLEDLEGLQITQVPYQDNGSSLKSNLVVGGFIAAGAIAGPLAVVGVVGALGFGAAGIAGGSWAAGFMSTYGGTVASGSLCALGQSIGAAGLGATGTAVASTVGAAVGGVGAKLFSRFSKSKNVEKKGETNQPNSEEKTCGDGRVDIIQPLLSDPKSDDNDKSGTIQSFLNNLKSKDDYKGDTTQSFLDKLKSDDGDEKREGHQFKERSSFKLKFD